VKVTVVSHPIFLTPGCAIEDFNWPDRILLGTGLSEAVLMFKQVYRPLVMRGVPIIVTTRATAELVRQAATAFIATKISFINEVAAICEHVKADASDLSLALGLDKRIGPRCLQPGTTFGGAFGSGDMNAIEELAGRCGVSLKVLGAAREVNRDVCERLADKISVAVDTLPGKQVGMLGLAFKPNTNCVAGSTSVMLAKSLLERGAQVRAYDPAALADAKRELNGSVHYCDSAYSAIEASDAMVVATGWPEFRALDWAKVKKLLKRPVIVDTKNLLDSEPLRSMGFRYVGVGRA
jgi:UDPglucose 6-dehydrogenase